jgi:histidinol-phosphate aminotransferase
MSFTELPYLKNVSAYVPGKQPQTEGWVKLNTNENPYPPSPKVAESIIQASERLRLYPDPSCKKLRDVIATHHGVSSDAIVVGNGSDDILNVLCRSYCDTEHSGVMLDPSYSHYPVLAGLQNVELIQVPFKGNFEIDVDRILELNPNILFLTSPNAPLSIGFSQAAIRCLAQKYSGLIVIDEAYADFAEEDAIPLFHEFNNIVITRTLSKSYALAGLRVGYAIAPMEVVEVLNKVRDPYNVNALSQAGAIAALQDVNYYKGTIENIISTREEYRDYFEKMGWKVNKSQANFLFIEPRDRLGNTGLQVVESLYHFLEENLVLVRYFKKHKETQNYIRVTIGTDVEMKRFKEVVEIWMTKDTQK